MKSLWSSTPFSIALTLLILVLVAVIEHAMGRIPICDCGYIKLWAGNVLSNENSQMISDWYTFSHIIHGFFFFWLFSVLKFTKKLPLQVRFLLSLLIEAAWEVLENSPVIINRYRENTVSLDYYGDSILNSISDVVAMILGFWLALKLPVKISLVLVILMELVVGYIIRDNLTLNIIMLLYPLDVIKDWQMG